MQYAILVLNDATPFKFFAFKQCPETRIDFIGVKQLQLNVHKHFIWFVEVICVNARKYLDIFSLVPFSWNILQIGFITLRVISDNIKELNLFKTIRKCTLWHWYLPVTCFFSSKIIQMNSCNIQNHLFCIIYFLRKAISNGFLLMILCDEICLIEMTMK